MGDTRDLRDLLQVLQQEERFLKSGGYERPPVSRNDGPALIFQDSPSCPNHGTASHSIPCRECVLAPLIPAKGLKEKVPCRHIRLNSAGETVEMLYQWRTLAEAKKILGDWLAKTILRLTQQRFLKQSKAPKPGRNTTFRIVLRPVMQVTTGSRHGHGKQTQALIV